MPKGFAGWLVARGVVSVEDVTGALEDQMKRQLPIGRVLVMEGIMSHEAVLEILDYQRTSSFSRPFSEIARSLGFASEDDIERCLELQMETRPPIGEILVERGAMSHDQLEEELEAFKANQPVR